VSIEATATLSALEVLYVIALYKSTFTYLLTYYGLLPSYCFALLHADPQQNKLLCHVHAVADAHGEH